jgi:hypothetical protein
VLQGCYTGVRMVFSLIRTLSLFPFAGSASLYLLVALSCHLFGSRSASPAAASPARTAQLGQRPLPPWAPRHVAVDHAAERSGSTSQAFAAATPGREWAGGEKHAGAGRAERATGSRELCARFHVSRTEPAPAHPLTHTPWQAQVPCAHRASRATGW